VKLGRPNEERPKKKGQRRRAGMGLSGTADKQRKEEEDTRFNNVTGDPGKSSFV
jgi:hypothetical protein